MSSVVTARLAVLVASMRAGGARVGVGDLLTAHRALAAVDASSRHESFLALRGQGLEAQSLTAAADLAAEGIDPPADLNADADYKRHLTRVLTRRALEQAIAGGA